MGEKEKRQNDQTIFWELLYLEQFSLVQYNDSLLDCRDTKIRQEFLSLLVNEHQIIFDLSDEMSKRGWIGFSLADYKNIQKIKQKYSELLNGLNL